MNKRKKAIYFITRVAAWSAIATILAMVEALTFPIIPGFSFLKIHLEEIPILIAGMAYGPFEALFILVIKSLFKLIQDIPLTAGIGVLADFIYSLFFIIPPTIIYKKWNNKKGFAIGISIGTILQLAVSLVLGVLWIFPFYQSIFHLEVLNDINFILGFSVILPFNAIKDGIVLAISIIVLLILFVPKWRKKNAPDVIERH